MAKTPLQQQQESCIQIFTMMFQNYLDKYAGNKPGQEKNLMRMILETHVFTYNALPDKVKERLYKRNAKVLDELLGTSGHATEMYNLGKAKAQETARSWGYNLIEDGLPPENARVLALNHENEDDLIPYIAEYDDERWIIHRGVGEIISLNQVIAWRYIPFK